MELHNLKPAKGSKKSSRRIGRGESSGAGKTSGKGGKGQTARTGGGVRAGFEGGQMPLYRRLPKLGFRSRKQVLGINRFNVINLSDLEMFDNGTEVTVELLDQSKLSGKSGNQAGYKILGKGDLTKKLNIAVQACSESAKSKIEALGGTVKLIESKTKKKSADAAK